MTTFIDYLKQYDNDIGLEGDFARDVRTDKGFPRQRADLLKYYKIILRHMKLMHACPDAIMVFNEIWSNYIASQEV